MLCAYCLTHTDIYSVALPYFHKTLFSPPSSFFLDEGLISCNILNNLYVNNVISGSSENKVITTMPENSFLKLCKLF